MVVVAANIDEHVLVVLLEVLVVLLLQRIQIVLLALLILALYCFSACIYFKLLVQIGVILVNPAAKLVLVGKIIGLIV